MSVFKRWTCEHHPWRRNPTTYLLVLTTTSLLQWLERLYVTLQSICVFFSVNSDCKEELDETCADFEEVLDETRGASDESAFEIPPRKYTAERIIRILLDLSIDNSKVCKQHPFAVTMSSTYVIDLNSLLDPEDVKRNNFRVWGHSGSYTITFESRISEKGELEIGKGHSSMSDEAWERFSLWRLHSIHPSNALFRRLMAFFTGMFKP